MKKFLKYTVVSIFLIAFLLVTTELTLIYSKFSEKLFNPYYIFKEEFRNPALHKNSNKKSIILMGCSFFYDPFLKEKDIAHTLLSKQTKRNVYNLALTGSSVAESLYILRNYDDNIALKKILNNDFNIEHIIINYMPWHVKSLLISPRGMCPRFKKDNGKLILNTNPLYNTEICTALNILVRRNTQYKIPPITFNLYIEHVKEIKKEIEKQFGKDAKLTILVVKEFGFEDWDKLKKEGINIINLNEILGFDINTKEYQISYRNDHPNKKAWEVIVPALIKELNL